MNSRLCFQSVTAAVLVSCQTDGIFRLIRFFSAFCLIAGFVAVTLALGLAVGRLALAFVLVFADGEVVFFAIALSVITHLAESSYSLLDWWVGTKQTGQTVALERVYKKQVCC